MTTDPRKQQETQFFDARDAVQVKYEMVRRAVVEGDSVTAAAAAFGYSKPSYYAAARGQRSAGDDGSAVGDEAGALSLAGVEVAQRRSRPSIPGPARPGPPRRRAALALAPSARTSRRGCRGRIRSCDVSNPCSYGGPGGFHLPQRSTQPGPHNPENPKQRHDE